MLLRKLNRASEPTVSFVNNLELAHRTLWICIEV